MNMPLIHEKTTSMFIFNYEAVWFGFALKFKSFHCL